MDGAWRIRLARQVGCVGGRCPATKKMYFKMPDGTVEAANFDSRVVKVVFCAANDENLTSQTQFYLPPVESQMDVYEHGYFSEADAKSKSAKQGGFFAKQFKLFLGQCLGFVCDARNALPKEAGMFKYWKAWPDGSPRLINLVVRKGKLQPSREDPKNPGVMLPARAYDQPDIFKSVGIPHSNKCKARSQARAAPGATPEPAPEPEHAEKKGKKAKAATA